ncbi:hypothetical protein GIB67_038084, partial [Kingdonia uniflora]
PSWIFVFNKTPILVFSERGDLEDCYPTTIKHKDLQSGTSGDDLGFSKWFESFQDNSGFTMPPKNKKA